MDLRFHKRALYNQFGIKDKCHSMSSKRPKKEFQLTLLGEAKSLSELHTPPLSFKLVAEVGDSDTIVLSVEDSLERQYRCASMMILGTEDYLPLNGNKTAACFQREAETIFQGGSLALISYTLSAASCKISNQGSFTICTHTDSQPNDIWTIEFSFCCVRNNLNWVRKIEMIEADIKHLEALKALNKQLPYGGTSDLLKEITVEALEARLEYKNKLKNLLQELHSPTGQKRKASSFL